MRTAAAALAGTLAIFGLLVWLALEGGGGVAVLETRAPNGTPRTTRVWVVEAPDRLWLEAATPDRPWLRDVEMDPVVSLARDGRRTAFRAVAHPGEDARRLVRGWLRERYGWRDVFVGLLQDTSQAVAVRLEPLVPSVRPPR